jgi:hypothetical protein
MIVILHAKIHEKLSYIQPILQGHANRVCVALSIRNTSQNGAIK